MRASAISACTATRRLCAPSATTRTSRPAWRTPRCSSSTRCSRPAAAPSRRSAASSARARSASRSSAWWRLPRACRRCAPHIPRCRSSPPRSTASSTTTATSGRDWVMRVTASSGPIAEDERRYRVLVDANVVGVTVSDAEHVYEANDAWLRITGHTRAEQESGQLSWRAITPPEWAAADDRAMEQLASAGWVEPYEKEYTRPDGTRVPVLISGVRLDSDPLRVVAIIIDLTDRRTAERERERLLE